MHAPRRILVIDDEAPIREYMMLALETGGDVVSAREAFDPTDAAPGAWDLAFVDLVSSGAADPCRTVAALAAHQVPVVVFTGLPPDAPLVQQALAAGARTVLRKPFGIDELRAAVATHAAAPQVSGRTGRPGSRG